MVAFKWGIPIASSFLWCICLFTYFPKFSSISPDIKCTILCTFFDNSLFDSLLLSLVSSFFSFVFLDLVLGSHPQETAAIFGSTMTFFLFISYLDVKKEKSQVKTITSQCTTYSIIKTTGIFWFLNSLAQSIPQYHHLIKHGSKFQLSWGVWDFALITWWISSQVQLKLMNI